MRTSGLVLPLVLVFGCPRQEDSDTGVADTDTDTDADTDTDVEPTACETLGLPELPFQTEGEFGYHRRELADDFELPMPDGTTWVWSENYTGCDVVVFIPNYLPVSDLDGNSVWTTGVAELIDDSPKNAIYVFVTMGNDDDAALANALEMQERIDEALAGLSEADADWWRPRLLTPSIAQRSLSGWTRSALGTIGTYGIAIDREQKVRGTGSLSAVEAFDTMLYNQGYWPWEAELFSAAREVVYLNFEAEREARLAEHDATEVVLFGGEVEEEYADVTVTVPALGDNDTLEIDVLMECPDTDAAEAGNCGAWDYLAHLWLLDDDGETWLEVARFITTYHRESRWVVDASHAIPWLADGGERTFRYSWAPSWNTQPTGITVKLRYTDQGKGSVPVEVHPLHQGGDYNSAYNDGREAVTVAIPGDATKVELVAIITGHGGATNNCAEFCNHQHEFTVGAASYLREFPDASTERGCQRDVEEGTVPNQWGTWWFGRGGWCPGRRVDPWVVDVTAEATAGADVDVTYRGLWRDGESIPDNSGNILMNSWLVISR